MTPPRSVPPDRPRLVAVTGTNGKTSVATFTYQLFRAVGWAGSSYTSHGLRSPDGTLAPVEVENTATFLPAMIAGEQASGAEAMAIEAFAAALQIGIHAAMEVDVAVCTGVESDHLDFHGTPEAYLAAKLLLFSQVLRPDGVAVVPVGGAACDVVCEVAAHRGIRTVRVGEGGEVALAHAEVVGESLHARLMIDGAEIGAVHLPFRDAITVQNALLAAAAVWCLGASPAQVAAGLATLEPPAGRLQRVGEFDGVEVVVDTAHNPGALRTALRAVRDRAPRRVILVFGAGGERDAVKRPEMGLVAAELADVVVLTDDNPRRESPSAIRAAVRRGCPQAIEIPNRIDGIHAALRMARPGDVVLIAGRGDEEAQEIDGAEFAVDDRQVARSLMAMLNAARPG